jgi:LacI family transcriptional regulator
MQELLALATPPTAVFACNDLMALGAIRAIEEAGLQVGADIAVVGFDDSQWAERIRPTLTAVRQPVYNIGLILSRMLIGLISGNPPAETQVVLPPSLIIRESSGAALFTKHNDSLILKNEEV